MAKVNGKGQAVILTGEQIEQILKCAREPYRLAIAIAAYTGCRMGEAIALKAENLRDGHITFTETKNDVAREVPLHPKLQAMLAAANLPKTGYLFPSNGGRSHPHLTRQATWNELKSVCEALAIEGVGTHSFRRTALTLMKNAGVPLKDIACISGHKSLDQLSRYLEVTENEKQAAIACLSF